MIPRVSRIITTLLALLLLHQPAQSDEIKLRNGSRLSGRIVKQSDQEVVILLGGASGTRMVVPRRQIASVEVTGPHSPAPEAREPASGVAPDRPGASGAGTGPGDDEVGAAARARFEQALKRIRAEFDREAERIKRKWSKEYDAIREARRSRQIRDAGTPMRRITKHRDAALERASQAYGRKRQQLEQRYLAELAEIRQAREASGDAGDVRRVKRTETFIREQQAERRIQRGDVHVVRKYLTVPGKDDRSLNASERWLRGLAILRLREMRSAAAPAVPDLIRLLGLDVNMRKPAMMTWIIKGRPWDGKITETVYLPEEVASTLTRIGERAVGPLLAALGDPNPVRREFAANALLWSHAAGGNVSVGSALKPLLEDPVGKVRAAAARALGHHGGAWAAEPLMNLALGDSEDLVRARARSALARLGASHAFSPAPLVHALDSPDKARRRAAVRALSKLSKLPDCRSTVAAALRRVGADEDPRLRALAAEGRSAAAGSHATAGYASTVPGLIAALRDENESVRISAARSLARRNEPAAVLPLISALKDEAVHDIAVRALGQSRDPRAIAPLFDSLVASTSSNPPEIRALGQMDPGRLLPLLERKLRDPRPGVRIAVLRVVARVRSGEPTSCLVKALSDRDEGVRVQAVVGLASTRDPAVRSRLVKCLQDRSARVRAEAARALGRDRQPSLVAPLIRALADRDARVRANAQKALCIITRRRTESASPAEWTRWWEAHGQTGRRARGRSNPRPSRRR